MRSTSLIRKIIRNPLVQTLALYISGGWILIELLEYFIANFNLDPRFRNILLSILLCGLPVALLLSWILSREKGDGEKTISRSGIAHRGRISKIIHNPFVSIPALILLLLLIIFGIRYFSRTSKMNWAREEALGQIENLVHEMNMPAAFELVNKARQYIPDDPRLKEISAMVIRRVTILSDPPGAEVLARIYDDPDGEWKSLGSTPIDSMEMPYFTLFSMKFMKSGYTDVFAAVPSSVDTIYRKLFKDGIIPEGMVYIEGLGEEVSGDFQGNKHSFFIDRYEVTNRQFKEFVDRGGYRDPSCWNTGFESQGRELPWDEAMTLFTDATGRPGPAGWHASVYPEGEDNLPVSGISWYEAAAYAAFAGKSLPTQMHWATAAGQYYNYIYYHFGSLIKKNSNFRGTGPAPVEETGMNSFGTYGMAGNVREWCWNGTPAGHVIRGGAWNDAEYMFSNNSQSPSMDRSLKNGFRCVKYIDLESIPELVFEPVEIQLYRDYTREKPEPLYVFEIFRNQYSYDPKPLDAVVENVDESPKEWVIEKVSFNAAYDSERVIGYLYKPKDTKPPLETLIFFPGSYAVSEADLTESRYTLWFGDHFLKNGRALFFPVYKGTYQRNDGLTVEMHIANRSHEYTGWLIKWVQDLSRSIDYLETRPDIDTGNIGYYAHSWGGLFGGLIPAVEPRIKASILINGGFDTYGDPYPEADPLHYISHITSPVLMLNGRYDARFPLETTVQPFYDLLGTPERDKYLVITETDHFVPKAILIRESLNFLDTYFGMVK